MLGHLVGFLLCWLGTTGYRHGTAQVVTLLVGLLKAEGQISPEDEPEAVSIISAAYRHMFQILQLHPIRLLMLLLVTWKFPFAIADGVAPLKLQEFGVKKEHMAYIASGMMPVCILLPAVVSRWTNNAAPWNLAMQTYPWRVLLASWPEAVSDQRAPEVLISAVLVSFTPSSLKQSSNEIPWLFLGRPGKHYFGRLCTSEVASQCMFVSTMAFFARISDPAMGGTYMTLLTLDGENLKGMWPGTVMLKFIDASSCLSESCVVKRDGLSFAYGVLWYLLAGSQLRRVQTVKLSDWRL
eukprot:Skav217551  [mRNA]  locus=scaffold1602:62260:77712:+ [translate_table: standard]